MLLKTKANVLHISRAAEAALVNIDNLRADGAYDFTSADGGGVFPDGAVFPASLVVSDSGDTQTLTDDTPTVSVRSFGLDWWGEWV